MIYTTFLGPDSHETLSDEILASTNVATFGSWVHGLPSCCMNTNAHCECDQRPIALSLVLGALQMHNAAAGPAGTLPALKRTMRETL